MSSSLTFVESVTYFVIIVFALLVRDVIKKLVIYDYKFKSIDKWIDVGGKMISAIKDNFDIDSTDKSIKNSISIGNTDIIDISKGNTKGNKKISNKKKIQKENERLKNEIYSLKKKLYNTSYNNSRKYSPDEYYSDTSVSYCSSCNEQKNI